MSEVPNGTFDDTGAVYVNPNPGPVTPTSPPPPPSTPVPPSAGLSQALSQALGSNGPPQNNNVPASTGGSVGSLGSAGGGLVNAIRNAITGSSSGQPDANGSNGYSYTPPLKGGVELPGWANIALKLAGMAPGVYGIPGTLASAGIAANNVVAGNVQREKYGLAPTDPISFLSGVFGLNNRGDTGGNATIADPGELSLPNGESPAVTQSGLYENSNFGFLARLLGDFGIGNGYFDPTGAMTQGEYSTRIAQNGMPGTAGGIPPASIAGQSDSAGSAMASALKSDAGSGGVHWVQTQGGKDAQGHWEDASGNNLGGNTGSFNSGQGGQVRDLGAGMTAKQLADAGLGYDPTSGGFVSTNQGNAAGNTNTGGSSGNFGGVPSGARM